ncbi:MAG TPA: biotin/lipoyl-binding protein, partial [Bryobacteraceae bacterium]
MVLLSAGCNRQEAVQARGMVTPTVRVVPAVTLDIPLDIASIGNVEAIASVDVKSRLAGQVTRVNFREGQDVQAGELLFELDREPLLSQIGEL